MKVLVIGFCKTGTKSLCAALRELGYKVYDYEDNFYNLDKQWRKVLSGKGGTTQDFYEMYKDVDASMDVPVCMFWEEILKAFPDMKLIFNERVSDEDWWKSMRKTLDNIDSTTDMKIASFLSPTAFGLHRWTQLINRVAHGAPRQWTINTAKGVSPTLAKIIYRTHNARVKEVAPKEQLLYFHPREGWEPLCKFLQLEIPDTPFPYKNKGSALVDEWKESSPIYRQILREMTISVSIIVFVLSCTLIYVIWF